MLCTLNQALPYRNFLEIATSRETQQFRLPVFLLATRVAEGRGVLDVMAVSTLPSKMRPK